MYIKNNEVIYFVSFGVEHVPTEIKRFVGHKNTKTNVFTIQVENSIMCGYFCIGFIDFMFAGRSLIDFTSLFSPYDLIKKFLISLNELIFLSKKLSKYIAAFDYTDKTLIVFSATSGGMIIISFTSVIIPAGIISAGFTLIFS